VISDREPTRRSWAQVLSGLGNSSRNWSAGLSSREQSTAATRRQGGRGPTFPADREERSRSAVAPASTLGRR
jgi:hypothetical protein